MAVLRLSHPDEDELSITTVRPVSRRELDVLFAAEDEDSDEEISLGEEDFDEAISLAKEHLYAEMSPAEVFQRQFAEAFPARAAPKPLLPPRRPPPLPSRRRGPPPLPFQHQHATFEVDDVTLGRALPRCEDEDEEETLRYLRAREDDEETLRRLIKHPSRSPIEDARGRGGDPRKRQRRWLRFSFAVLVIAVIAAALVESGAARRMATHIDPFVAHQLKLRHPVLRK
jgi:hypothetical protein